MKRIWKHLRIGALIALGGAGLILLVVGGIAVAKSGASTPEIEGTDPVAELVSVEIGGTSQTLLIRGADRNAPLILFLHGGPGTSAIPLNNGVMQLIEREFVLVNWDQRASGTSYYRGSDFSDVTLDTYNDDIREVVEYLRRRFSVDRIVLVGHSWGSAIGLRFAAQHPELLHAFVGMGQLINIARNGEVSFSWVLGEARRDGNLLAISELEAIGGLGEGTTQSQAATYRKWLDHYGGSTRSGSTIASYLRRAIFHTPEFTLRDIINVIRSSLEQIVSLDEELAALALDEEISRVNVPVYFFLGRFDYQTPSIIAEEFLEQLDAPEKRIVWFEESAHAPFVEERDWYQRVIVDLLQSRLGLENPNGST